MYVDFVIFITNNFKKILLIIIIILVVWFLANVIFSILGVTVTGRSAMYINDYSEFYFHKRVFTPARGFDFGGGRSGGYTIWFLPGQKGRLLERIKEDVNNELTNHIANNSNILNRYEISDDFRRIYIFHYKNTNLFHTSRLDDSILPRMELYHQLIHGSRSVRVNYIEVDEPLP